MIRVEVVRAWPRCHEARWLELDEASTVADAIAACGYAQGPAAVFGERAEPARLLAHGDRIELLRPLIADPKDARRRRAARGTR